MWEFAGSLIIAIITFILTHFSKRKADVRFYYGPISDIPLPNQHKSTLESERNSQDNTPIGPEQGYRMHAVVILNAGDETAYNIRIGHTWLPPVHSVNPPMNIPNPDNPKEILIPTLCAGERVTISYLYLTSINVAHVTCYIKSDQGLGKAGNLQHVKTLPSILVFFKTLTFYAGIFSLIYAGLNIIDFLLESYNISIG